MCYNPNVTDLEIMVKIVKERHPVYSSKKPTIPSNAQVLILGSAPGEDTIKQRKLLDNDEYYSDKNNKFWDIIEKKYKLEPNLKIKNYDYKKKILEICKIGLWDILSYCTRIGSSDSTINDEKYNNIADWLVKFQSIKRIILNGKGNIDRFNKCIENNNISKSIEIVPLVSTSGSYWDCQDKEERDKWFLYLPD